MCECERKYYECPACRGKLHQIGFSKQGAIKYECATPGCKVVHLKVIE